MAERFRVERRPRQPRQPHPALVERTSLVLDYMRAGYYMDPHKHHRSTAVVQAIGCDRFTLLDGIPISGEVDFLEKVTNTMEMLKTVFYPVEERGRPSQKRQNIHLACLQSERKLYCYPLTPIGEKEYELLPLSFDDPDSVVILRSYEELEDMLSSAGLPRKVIAVPPTPISYDDLTMTARENLTEAVKKIVREREGFFVEFFNVAEPINVRLHAIELLKGIGKRVLLKVLDRRRRQPFKSFDEVKQILKRDPVEMLADKIVEEIKGEAKYYLFVKPKDPAQPFLNYLDIMRRAYNARRGRL